MDSRRSVAPPVVVPESRRSGARPFEFGKQRPFQLKLLVELVYEKEKKCVYVGKTERHCVCEKVRVHVCVLKRKSRVCVCKREADL